MSGRKLNLKGFTFNGINYSPTKAGRWYFKRASHSQPPILKI